MLAIPQPPESTACALLGLWQNLPRRISQNPKKLFAHQNCRERDRYQPRVNFQTARELETCTKEKPGNRRDGWENQSKAANAALLVENAYLHLFAHPERASARSSTETGSNSRRGISDAASSELFDVVPQHRCLPVNFQEKNRLEESCDKPEPNIAIEKVHHNSEGATAATNRKVR